MGFRRLAAHTSPLTLAERKGGCVSSSEDQRTFLEPQRGLNLEDLEGWDQLPQEVKKELGIYWLDTRATVDTLVGDYEEQIRLSPDHLRPELYEKYFFDHFNHVAYSMMALSLAGAPDGQINPFYHPFLNQIAEQECNHLKHRYGLHKKPVEPTAEEAARWRAMDPRGEMDRLMGQLRLKQEEHVRQFRARLQARIFVLLGEASADKAKMEKKAVDQRRNAGEPSAQALARIQQPARHSQLLAEWETVKNSPIDSKLLALIPRFKSFEKEAPIDFHFTVDVPGGVCLCQEKFGIRFDGLAAEAGEILGRSAGAARTADRDWANFWKFCLWFYLKGRCSSEVKPERRVASEPLSDRIS